MYEVNCYFDNSRCIKDYEHNVDESKSNQNCFIVLLFGSLEGQNTDSSSVDNYLQVTKEVINNQANSLLMTADPSKNILFGFPSFACHVLLGMEMYDHQSGGQQALDRLCTFMRKSHPNAKYTNCAITALATDPATNTYSRPLANTLSFDQNRFHATKK